MVKYWLNKAAFETKRAARPDYYKILNVSSLASDREIKASYKSMCLVHHPDRHTGSSLPERQAAEETFKLLQVRRKKPILGSVCAVVS